MTLRFTYLTTIEHKVLHKQRLHPHEGLSLLDTEDPQAIHQIGELANLMRRQMVGDEVPYAHTLYLYPTNLCVLQCPLCSFYAAPGSPHGWLRSPEELFSSVHPHASQLTEVHIVGGVWPECNLDYYRNLLKLIHTTYPHIHIKALTAVEYDYLGHLHRMSIRDLLSTFLSLGLGSLPGGGAEILVERIRRKIAPHKISSSRFLEIHRIAHTLGIPSNVTMLFGHIESPSDLITHMLKIRHLQDQTGGVVAFVPLLFQAAHTKLNRNTLSPKPLSLIYAVSRLMLDNIPHIKVLWNYVGMEQALTLLNQGGSDISSTHLEEKVSGCNSSSPSLDILESLLKRMGRIPKKTHSGPLCSL